MNRSRYLWVLLALCLTSCSAVDYSKPGPKDSDVPEDLEWTTTASGLKYRMLRKGSGRNPKKSDTVVCSYKGWLDDGTEFDSSYKKGAPLTYPLARFIAGWIEGIQLMHEGGMIELIVPSELGYRDDPPPGIPSNATLNFLVELHQIK